MPLKFTARAGVRTFEVLTKAELRAALEHKGGLPEMPRWCLPGPDRRATVVITTGQMVELVPLIVEAEVAAEIQSGLLEVPTTEECIRLMNYPEMQRRVKNNVDFS
ncbi:hypothetical protein FOA52_008077 [Chlamydomonas sp. UWO 241]|nr:hypothetical protein FOA52_008077 [Chlamydomonas sp. UWO 241]